MRKAGRVAVAFGDVQACSITEVRMSETGTETAFATSDVRWRSEDFGYIVALPNGDIDMYDQGVQDLLNRERVLLSDINAHRLREFAFTSRGFHLRHPLIVSIELSRSCELR